MNQDLLRSKLVTGEISPRGKHVVNTTASRKAETGGDAPNVVLAQERTDHLGLHAALHTHKVDQAHFPI